jgi:hypothetical protein
VVVEGAEANVGLICDLVDPRVVDALASEQLPGSLHEPGAGLVAPAGVAVGWRGADGPAA